MVYESYYERYSPRPYKKDLSRSVIYKVQNSWVSRDNVDGLRQQYLVFIGMCYTFVCSYQDNVNLR